MTATTGPAESAVPHDADELRPSLTSRSNPRPSGFLASLAWWLIQILEPAGYAAGFLVGIGLWALLDAHFMALADLPTTGLLIASAAGLWWAAWQIGRFDFEETWRLGNVVYASAIGTTAWIGWVATDGALVREVRFTITALVVSLLAYLVQRFRGDLLTYIMLLGAAGVSAVSLAVTISGAVGIASEGPIAVASMVAAAVGYLIAGRSDSPTRRDVTNYAIVVGSVVVLVAAFALPADWRLAVAIAGFLAAGVANWAIRPTPRSSLIAATTNTVLAAPLAISWLPWARIIDAIPVPIMAIVAGSAVLIALGWAVRRVLSPNQSIMKTADSTT